MCVSNLLQASIIIISSVQLLQQHPRGGKSMSVDMGFVTGTEEGWLGSVPKKYGCEQLYTDKQKEGKDGKRLRGGGARLDGTWQEHVMKRSTKLNRPGTSGGL